MSEEKNKSTIPKVHVMPTKDAPPKGNVGPSALRQLLPIISCLLSFASVLTVLIIYMDKTGESFFLLTHFTCRWKFIFANFAVAK